jgi:hypothetical protein
VRHGRALDLLITHSPPRHVGDREDHAHQGFEAIRTFIRWFQPVYHLHGHIHLYDRSQPCETRFLDTDVINVFPYKRLDLAFDALATPRAEDATSPALEAQRHHDSTMEVNLAHDRGSAPR